MFCKFIFLGAVIMALSCHGELQSVKAKDVNNYFRHANIFMSSIGGLYVKAKTVKKQETVIPKTSTLELTKTAPKSTTKAPESTTKAPELTTTAPKLTTKAPESTTNAPELTTTAPEPTTKAPEPTTTTKKPKVCKRKYNVTVGDDYSDGSPRTTSTVLRCEESCVLDAKCLSYFFNTIQKRNCFHYDYDFTPYTTPGKHIVGKCI